MPTDAQEICTKELTRLLEEGNLINKDVSLQYKVNKEGFLHCDTGPAVTGLGIDPMYFFHGNKAQSIEEFNDSNWREKILYERIK